MSLDPARRVVLAVAAALAAILIYGGSLAGTPGGLPGQYSFVGADGRDVEVLRRSDPAIDFPIHERLDAAYIFHWDYARFGFPAEKPSYLIRWRGFLDVPEAGDYRFMVDAQGEATLALDGAPLALVPDATTVRTLAAGPHAIAVDYTLAEGDARLVLSWQPPGGRMAPIDTRFLGASREAFAAAAASRRLGLLLVAAVAAALAAAWWIGRPAAENTRPRWASALEAERTRLALGAIVLLAALLRFNDYALVPFHNETADEYQHAWEGWHLLHEGTPAAWSTFPDRYPPSATRSFRWFGAPYVLVRPYFDHPPLFSLPVGLLCSLAGARTFLDCTLPVMRIVPILLSLVGIVLLYRLSRAYGGSERAALLGSLVYATLPLLVLTHRLVKAESLLALLFMGALLALRDALTDAVPEGAGEPAAAPATARCRRGALVAGLLGALSIWTKATGVIVPVVAAGLLLSRRRRTDAAIVVGLAAGAVGIYLMYGMAYDAGVFFKVLAAQSTTKWVSMEAFHDLLGGKAVVKWFGRGTYLWLLLAGVLAGFGRHRRLLLPLVLYGSLLALTADHRVVYGWYRLPLYPFLCVAAGLYLERLLDEADLSIAFPFAVTALLSGLLYALPETMAQSRPAAWLFAAAAVAPFLPRLLTDRPWAIRVARGGAAFLLAAFLVANLAADARLVDIYAATRGLQ